MKFFKRHYLKVKMFLMVSVTVISIIGLLGITVNMVFFDISKKRLQDSYQQMIKERSNIMIMSIDNVVYRLCDEIIVNDTIYDALFNYEKLSPSDLLETHRKIKDFIGSKYYFLSAIKKISIITDDGKVLFDEGYNVGFDKYIKQVTDMANSANGKTVWDYVKIDGIKPVSYMITARAINVRFQRKNRVGYVIMTISEEYFRNLFADLYLGDETQVVVLNQDNEVVSAAKQDSVLGTVGSKLDFLPGQDEEVWPAGDYFPIEDENGKKYTVMHSEIEQAGWRLVGLVEDDYLDYEANIFSKLLVIIAVIALILILLIISVLSRSIFKPLDALISHMEHTNEGLPKPFTGDKQPGEIEILADAYNVQVEQIRKLVEEIKEKEKNKNKIKMQFLQAQINPHFLFNTLDSLQWVSVMSRCDNVASGINALSDLLRTSLSEKEYITLREEIHNIKNYITIMKIRFNEYFDVKICLPREMENLYILKMLLQPIIENSIIHGISNLQKKGLIEIEAKQVNKNRDIEIIVRDNGVGFDKEADSVRYKENSKKGFHIGMDNVAERISLYYGREYGYEVRSEQGIGTEVIFTLPLIEREG